MFFLLLKYFPEPILLSHRLFTYEPNARENALVFAKSHRQESSSRAEKWKNRKLLPAKNFFSLFFISFNFEERNAIKFISERGAEAQRALSATQRIALHRCIRYAPTADFIPRWPSSFPISSWSIFRGVDDPRARSHEPLVAAPREEETERRTFGDDHRGTRRTRRPYLSTRTH